MPGRVCEVTDCDRPAKGIRGLSARYCQTHWQRFRLYGFTHWLPVPQHQPPGVPQDHVDRLRSLPWPQLVNWCDMALDEHRLPRFADMDDSEFWRLFAAVFTTR